MAYKVLVVDDSQFFQVRLKQIINEHPDLDVVGVAANGQEAIDLEDSLRPDIISMDYEMPYLDGISAVRAILAKRPIPIVMFSSMTYEGATITLEALDAGAVDFIPKNFAEVSRDSAILKKRLHEKLLLFSQKAKPSVAARSTTQPSGVRPSALGANLSSKRSPRANVSAPNASKKRIKGQVKLVVIGASTGGPVAVSEIITRIPANFPAPIIVAQHMPENFTKAFSERLNRQSQLDVKEAEDGDILKPGCVYIAPGGYQLMLDKSGRSIRILPGDERLTYKPSVDVLFASAAGALGDKVLAIVLTGMGADGCDGAKLLKQKGATIWGQDKDSCVVYGMPAAVAKAGLTDDVLPLDQVWQRLVSDV